MTKPYLPSRSLEIDETEWEDWMSMTDAQMDAESDRVNKEFSAFLKAMTPLQEYRYWRRYILTSIMENRRRLRTPSLCTIQIVTEMWRKSIKRSQISLVKWRTFRATGTFPGSD